MRRATVNGAGIVLLAVATLVAGCGGNERPRTTAKPQPSASSPTSPTPSPGDPKFCAALRDQLSGLPKFFPKKFTDVSELMRYAQYLKATNAKLVESAPAEVAADVRLQAQVSNAAAEYYGRGKPPPVAIQNRLSSADYLAAAGNVARYATERCDIRPSPLPTAT